MSVNLVKGQKLNLSKEVAGLKKSNCWSRMGCSKAGVIWSSAKH